MGHKENNPVANALQQLGLTVETAGLVNVMTGDKMEQQKTQSQESHNSHEPKSNPNPNSGPMDRNQNKAPNESKQDFGQAGQN